MTANAADMTANSQQNKLYSQYNQQQMRPGFPQSPRPMTMGPPQRPGGTSMMGCYSSNGNTQQQRFLTGQSISQQGGPTPTLNQLLQAPNPLQRYQNSYNEYNAGQGMHKTMAGDINASAVPQYQGSNNPPHGWGSMRASSGYQQQVPGTMYRSQSAPMPDPSMKRPFMPPGQQGPPQSQYTQQYSQRSYPQGATSPINQGYSQQMGGQYNMQQGPLASQMGVFDQRPTPQQQPQQQQPQQSPQQAPQQPQQQPQQPQQATTPQPQQPSTPQHQSQSQMAGYAQSAQELGSSLEDVSGEPGGSSTPGLRTPPASQSQGQQAHAVVSPLRPAPSPSGASTGSRSMSPAVGNQQNIPMPPRPSSSQSETSGSSHMTQSPMASQATVAGYGQQMAPPPMYGNKMHQGMMGCGSQVGPYSPQAAPYAQSNYPRSQSSMGMQGYGTQGQNSYPPSTASGYPAHTSMGRMANHTGATSQGYGSSGTATGYINSQFGSAGPPQGYGMSNMMPPPSQYPKASLQQAGGAQAAAQAAVMAAANSATMRTSPMYLRQHLQQKMYGNTYNSMQSQPQPGVPASMVGGPGSGGVPSPSQSHMMVSMQTSGASVPTPPSVPNSQEGATMPPPTCSTPSMHTPGTNQLSPLPPTVSTPTPVGSASGPDLSSDASQGMDVSFAQASTPAGTPSTMVTQSISSPISSPSVTVSSPSVISSEQAQQHLQQQLQQQQGRVSVSTPQASLPPPPILDEASQASNASASSSLPDDRSETPKANSKTTMSHPPTPNTLPSPGAASMSSFHDEFESVSSPSWPRTPASPRPDGLLKLYDMSDEPERRNFLDKLIMYNEERGTPITQCPTISKQPLDLFRLYLSVKERGGFVEVTKAKHWKDVAGCLGIGASSSAAYTLRKQYIKHLLPYECKYDRGGIDPQPIINQVEAATRKKSSKNSVASPGTSPREGFPQSGNAMDGYPSGYTASYAQASVPHGGPAMMANSDYPSPSPGQHTSYPPGPPHHPSQMPNHVGSAGGEGVSMQDPFSDEMQTSQYPRHSSSESYAYGQQSINAMMPPYSGSQSSMSGGSYGYTSSPMPQQEQYSEQYVSHPNMMPASENSYGNRNVMQDPYAPPANAYPPNRTISQAGTAQYSYQGHYDRERYEQQQAQTPLVRPSSQPNSMMGPTQGDHSVYPPQRYPSQQMAPRESMMSSTSTAYQGRPSIPPAQYHGQVAGQPTGQSSYPQGQQEGYRGPDTQPSYQTQLAAVQSTLAQRLMPKVSPTSQVSGYGTNQQQTMYAQGGQASNKVVPPGGPQRDMYQRDLYAPKRHPDFMKPQIPGQESYPVGPYNQQQPQGHYGDRSQYQYRSSPMMPASNSSPGQGGWSRESQYRQYGNAPIQGQYPPTPREGWEMSRPGDNQQAGPNAWTISRYGGHQPESYPPHMGGQPVGYKMPYGRDRVYMPPNKPHPGMGQTPSYQPPPPRKEIVFPPESVEATAPVLNKRRRLFSKDISPVEAWRLMMALKSGLLAESTWALDILSILLYDDSTVLYFGLNHLPGLLEVLMEHYRCCLSLIFGLANDLEVGYNAERHTKEVETSADERPPERKWYSGGKDPSADEPEVELGPVVHIDGNDKTSFLPGENFTHRTRCGKSVRTKLDEVLFLVDPEKKWDCYEGFNSGTDHWQLGGGDTTCHIQTHFENPFSYVRFVRIMEDIKKKEETDSEPDEGNDEECTESPASRKIPHLNCRKETDADLRHCTPKGEEKLCGDLPKTDAEDDVADDLSPKAIKVKTENESLETCSEGKTDAKEGDGPEVVSDLKSQTYPRVRPSPSPRKRLHLDDLEEEAYNRDEPSLHVVNSSQDTLARRCVCISTLLRNLSFVPGNDAEMSKHAGFLMVTGRLLCLHHLHSARKPPHRHYDREEDGDSSLAADSCTSLSGEQEWWWDLLHVLRENTLVTLANVTGQLDLAPYPEEISLPILDGLLHWAVCPSSYAQDPLPVLPPNSVLSPQRLSLEALCKLSIMENNVDLLLATPPWSRMQRLFSHLARFLCQNEDQVLREFSVVLLSNLAQADSGAARTIALQGTCISQLITFVEQAEQSALQVANSQGINALRENPELMGTTLDMVRRAAATLRCLARVPENRLLFLQQQQRLLALVMSQILDQGVASIVADVLYECSQEDVGEALNHLGSSAAASATVADSKNTPVSDTPDASGGDCNAEATACTPDTASATS